MGTIVPTKHRIARGRTHAHTPGKMGLVLVRERVPLVRALVLSDARYVHRMLLLREEELGAFSVSVVRSQRRQYYGASSYCRARVASFLAGTSGGPFTMYCSICPSPWLRPKIPLIVHFLAAILRCSISPPPSACAPLCL